MRARQVRLPLFGALPVLFLLGCLLPVPHAIAEPSRPVGGELEANVRRIIEQHCGSCHDSALATSKPAALQVFDLKAEDWTRSMSKEQLNMVRGRTKRLDLSEEQHREIAKLIEGKVSERARSARKPAR